MVTNENVNMKMKINYWCFILNHYHHQRQEQKAITVKVQETFDSLPLRNLINVLEDEWIILEKDREILVHALKEHDQYILPFLPLKNDIIDFEKTIAILHV